MPMLEKYRHYFDIDPDYFPAVNEAVITKNPEVWKKFFPHETFVKLLKNTISVLERKQKLCLWVEANLTLSILSRSCWTPVRKKLVNTSKGTSWIMIYATASRL